VTPGRATRRYGGNTSCAEVVGFGARRPGAASSPSNPRLVLDAGSGLAFLQPVLMREAFRRGGGRLPLLLSHCHWDHLQGLAMPFRPLLVPGNRIELYGASVDAMRSGVERLFTSVYSPLKGIQNIAADLAYHQLDDAEVEIAGFAVRTVRNRHPGGSLSFRIGYGSHAVVYSTDHEAGDAQVDARLVELARGADLWILDAEYTPQEWQDRQGWGHSSPHEATKLALRASVPVAVLSHHSAEHDDAMLDQLRDEAMQIAGDRGTEVLMGRDGMVVDIGR
jgi:phosphoribosyl 1,2-cyclic phosphodiesterase